MSRRISRALVLTEGTDGAEIHCARCDHTLAPAGSSWKAGATVREVPMQGVGGEAYSSGDQVLLRRFSCPNCGSLLDSETALPDDPFLEDIIKV